MKTILPTSVAIVLWTTLLPAPIAAQDAVKGSSNFNGAWVGFLGGHDHSTIDARRKTALQTSRFKRDRVLYGGLIGYDYKPKDIVYGVETEFSSGSLSPDNVVDIADPVRFEAGRDLYFGGRIGIPIASGAMVYAKGGYANLRVMAKAGSARDIIGKAATSLDGYRIGGGIQVNKGAVSARLEYRFSDYRHGDALSIHRDQVAAIISYGF